MRPTLSFDSEPAHAQHVISTVTQTSTEAPSDPLSRSWLRCANVLGVDPGGSAAPRILVASEVTDLRGPLEDLIVCARGEIDRLYTMVRPAGYAVLFCDMTGSVIEHRGEQASASQFIYWGTWLGGVWSEAAEGTNGIGTCIAEERPVTVHRGAHFRSRHKDLSCSAAPVFGIDGRMIAVLDVSAIDPNLSERAHGLTGVLTAAAARSIEERYFRERFPGEWVIAAGLPAEEGRLPVLLAVDGDQRIVGANRAARKSLALDDRALHAGVSLWSLFKRDLAPFRYGYGADVAARMVLPGSDVVCPAIVTPPIGGRRAGQRLADPGHASPRVEMLDALSNLASPPQACSGLPPAAIRRVRDYVEAHMSEHIDLTILAEVAGLSVYHFAREFKRSTGQTPHAYIVRKRIERAQHLLARTNHSLAEIAVAAGFSDQSHLARHFRQFVGATPREFRWSQR